MVSHCKKKKKIARCPKITPTLHFKYGNMGAHMAVKAPKTVEMASDRNKTKDAASSDWSSPRTPSRRRSHGLKSSVLSSVFTHELEPCFHIRRVRHKCVTNRDCMEDMFIFDLFQDLETFCFAPVPIIHPLSLTEQRYNLQISDISVYPTDICSQSKNTTQQDIDVALEEFKKLQLNKEKMNSSDPPSSFLVKSTNSTKSNGSMPPPMNSKEVLQEVDLFNTNSSGLFGFDDPIVPMDRNYLSSLALEL